MGKNIVRREHSNEPNKHSRLWIEEEIEDILANDEGTETTICLALRNSNTNAGTVMRGLGKMKKLRYLQVDFQIPNYAEVLDNTAQYFSNSLKYLKCWNYPFLYLPKTFQANNLVGLEMGMVGLEMVDSFRVVQLWEWGEKKVLPKLKFLSLSNSKLTTFDFRITPNLETLSLIYSPNLVELFMPVKCQKLNYLSISSSQLTTFDLGLTPNLEKLFLFYCADFEKLHVSSACPNLKFLELWQSRLRSLDLELFPNLEKLDLEGCVDFEELHVSSACPNLKFLELPKSSLRSLDLELFPNLEKLDFEGCVDFEELHVSSACPNLKFLKLCNSRLRSLDLELFPNLERLDLDGITKIKHLPDSICMLKCLKSLKVNYDDDPSEELTEDLLEILPEDLGQLECLEELYVRSKKIEYLSDSICMLKRLKSLNVNYCSCLGKLPEDIGQLESLESLGLAATKIKHLPDSICMLKRLKLLNLRGCALLEKLPEDIAATAKLLLWR